MKNTVLQNDLLYIVTMYRYGNLDNHSYITYITDNVNLAIKQCDIEEEYRGGKYTGQIIEMKLNKNDEDYKKIIKKL